VTLESLSIKDAQHPDQYMTLWECNRDEDVAVAITDFTRYYSIPVAIAPADAERLIVWLLAWKAERQPLATRNSQLATEDDAAVSANAELVATAIATFLVEEGALSIGDQIVAIRQQYALAWRAALVRAGFDDCAGMAALDIAEGVDLALSRLLDAAQEEYADDVVAPRPSQFAIHEEAQP